MPKLERIDGLQDRAVEVANLLKVLSHPHRLRIACQVLAGEKPVSEIEAKTGVPQPVLSRDLARLRAAGLVVTRRESKQVFYRVADPRLADLLSALCTAFAPPKKQAFKEAAKRLRKNSHQYAGAAK
jgi:DNA-binding transcriptional ArsR family regulator